MVGRPGRRLEGFDGEYLTWDDAEGRVQSLRELYGIWPGIRCHVDGSFSLMYNPPRLSRDLRNVYA